MKKTAKRESAARRRAENRFIQDLEPWKELIFEEWLPEYGSQLFRPGKASNFIGHAPKVLAADDAVGKWLRVSSSTQDRAGNLERGNRLLERTIDEYGCHCVGETRYVGSGKLQHGDGLVTKWGEARRLAEGSNATTLAVCTSRYIRNFFYRPGVPLDVELQATTLELLILREVFGPVRLATVYPPDATPLELSQMMGQDYPQVSEKKNGRPYKKMSRSERKEFLMPDIAAMHEDEMSPDRMLRALEEKYGRDRGTKFLPGRNTIYKWKSEL